MHDEIRDFLQKSVSHIPTSDAILIRREIPNISDYQSHEIFYIIHECIDVIFSYMKNGKPNILVEEKLEFFLDFFRLCSDDMQDITINFLCEKYNINENSFSLIEWKQLYNKFRSKHDSTQS
ncbi:MAG: hypothetical protein [Caudoviricetes sp.]|nr:MAG: hypothetical protein [Caudoviricetes sp.]